MRQSGARMVLGRQVNRIVERVHAFIGSIRCVGHMSVHYELSDGEIIKAELSFIPDWRLTAEVLASVVQATKAECGADVTVHNNFEFYVVEFRK